MSIRLNLSVDDDIPDKLSALAGGERKRGEYLSELVRTLHQSRHTEGVTVERLQVQIDGLIAQVKHLEGRLSRSERELAAMIAGAAGQ